MFRSELPKTNVGKILRRALKEEAPERQRNFFYSPYFLLIVMKSPLYAAVIMFLVFVLVGFRPAARVDPGTGNDSLRYPEERHLKNMRQLTFAADNAEAYWSFSGTKVTFQSNNPAWGFHCDQIFVMPTASESLRHGAIPQRISTGMGRTTCSFFMPGDQQILYASTHLGGKECPPDVERKPGGKYLWPIYNSYDIFVADLSGTIVRQLTNSPGYDARGNSFTPKRQDRVYLHAERRPRPLRHGPRRKKRQANHP